MTEQNSKWDFPGIVNSSVPDPRSDGEFKSVEDRDYIKSLVSGSNLSPKEIAVLEIHDMEGVTMREAAERLGMTLNQFNAKRQKILEKLRRQYLKDRKAIHLVDK